MRAIGAIKCRHQIELRQGHTELGGLKRPSNNGWVILGANELARQLAKLIEFGGDSVTLIERNHDSVNAAEREGLRVIFGNGLDERVLTQAEIDTRAGVIGLSPNSEVNLLFAQKARQEGKLGRILVSLGSGGSVTREMVHNEAAEWWSSVSACNPIIFGH